MRNIFIVGVLTAFAIGMWLWQKPVDSPERNPKTRQVPLQIGKVQVKTEVRITPEEQALGLSWRQALGQEEAMVFVYEQPQTVMYWMQGMQFPLDFIWAREGKVVEVTRNVPPPSEDKPEPERVGPFQPVDMVIEVNAGFIDRHEIKIGDEISLTNIPQWGI